MKPFLFLIALVTTLLSNAQGGYIPDENISVEGEFGNQKIIDYVNNRVLCKKVPADEIVGNVLNGLMGFRNGDKFGLMNIYGKIIVPATFDAYYKGEESYPIESRGDFFAVRKGETIGLIDSTGKFAVPLDNYNNIWDAKCGFGAAEKNGLFGLFKNGKNILPIAYESYYAYSGPFEFTQESKVIQQGELYGLINNKGVIVQPVKYLSIDDLVDNYWILNLDWQDYLADSTGKIVCN